MPQTVDTPAPGADTAKTVVLLVPEAMAGFNDRDRLRQTLVDPSRAIRVLLCLTAGDGGDTYATILDELGVETEILLGPGVPAPVTKAFVRQAPPDLSEKDQKEFALALSDVVLFPPRSEQTSVTTTAGVLFAQTVKDLGKLTVAAGDPLPEIPTFVSVTSSLDPDADNWRRACGRRVFGRLEQGLVELLAFNWSAPDKGSRAESRKRLRKCFSRWRPGAYFAPDAWRTLAPDRRAAEESSDIVARYNALDRSAVYGASKHRDFAWIAHFGAATAVLIAVLGHLLDGAAGWGILEFLILLLVASLVFMARYSILQERWTACRFGAEQLRIARMSLPLLVLPPALATADNAPASHGKEGELAALAEVKRVVRDHGLPRLDRVVIDHGAPRPDLPVTPEMAAEWLHLIVEDQVIYHNRNYRKLERAEARLVFITQLIFASAMAAVLLHFCWHSKWLLIVTAAAPAFAAALHGTGTRLGIVHRAALSIDAEAELIQIRDALGQLMRKPPAVDDAWRQVRQLAYKAAQAMGRESTSWHGLVRRYRDELP